MSVNVKKIKREKRKKFFVVYINVINMKIFVYNNVF